MNMTEETEAAIAEELLARIATYLDTLAGHVFEIEETVGNTIANKVVGDNLAIQNLQVLDFLRQSLEDLALMAVILRDPKTRPLTAETIEAVGRKLKLESTKNLLHSRRSYDNHVRSDGLGELDLF